MNYKSNLGCQLYMRYKRKDLKWYKKLLNYITGHKDRNWHWVPVDNGLERIEYE